MNFGVIGPGDIGEVIIRKLRDAGYSVKMANSRGPESLKDLAAKTGAIPASLEQVVQDVDMLFIVVPQKAIPELPKGLLNKAQKKRSLLMWAIIIPFATAVSMNLKMASQRVCGLKGRSGGPWSKPSTRFPQRH